MGFWSTLYDIFLTVADSQANKIDEMSDEELECRTKESGRQVFEYREMAANAHMLKNCRENNNSEDQ